MPPLIKEGLQEQLPFQQSGVAFLSRWVAFCGSRQSLNSHCTQAAAWKVQIIKACKAPGPLALSALSPEELALLEAMMNRLDRCAKAAFEVRSTACHCFVC